MKIFKNYYIPIMNQQISQKNTLLPSPLKPLKPQTNHSWVCVLCVCRYDISFTFVILTIESKLISLSLISDYSLITNLHIFVIYECTELSPISVDSKKSKLSILNKFGKT